MKRQAYIFNPKTLSNVLNRIGDASDPDIKEKRAIISSWIRALQNGKLDIIKETSIDQKFLDDFFVRVLGYQGVIGDSEVWNMIPQQKMKITSNRADGALGFFSSEQEDIQAVIELKDANTDLDSPQHRRNDKRTPVQQAFAYASEVGKTCKWVIVSNFKEIRLYHRSDMREYEDFFIKEILDSETLKKFYYLLCKENLISKDGESEIEKLYRFNTEKEKEISNKFYGEYKAARIHLFEHLKRNNPEKDEMLLLEKTQKILDRFIFVCFCEDEGLLPARIFRGTLENARNVIIELEDKNWFFILSLFKAINGGNPEHDINKFDGGLFAPDEDLDSLKLNDTIFEELAKITDYDFETDLNVNILGHIFEQSISDLEEIKTEINGEHLDKKKGKRKKEGIYYTPEYITHYIVENAIGGWLDDRKKELGFYDLPELTEKDYESIKYKKTGFIYNDNIKKHSEFWEAYKSILENIRVLDPACGSGAFLNQAFDYLYKDGQQVNKEIAKLKGGRYSLVDLDKSILSNNLYGVDLNSESVEITKLSLWLKTASKQKELTALDENIKCGNSLIDDKSIDPKAFEWEKEFPFKFDVVIGNPPYGAELDEKEWLKQRYPNTSFGNIDSYKYFVNKSIEMLKNNSRLGIIMPDSYLEKEYFRDLRLLIFNESAFIKNIKLGDNVFSEVNLPTAIVILLKKQEKRRIFQFLDISNYTESIEKQEALLREENVVSTNPDVEKTFITRKSIIDRVGCVNLIDAFDQVMGVKVYQIGKGKPKQTKYEFDNNVFISNKQENENYYPFISQGIGRYFYKPLTDEHIKYGRWLAEPRALNFFTNHKIIIREIVNPRIFATYIDYPAVVKNIAAVIIQKDQNYSLKYLLCLVNSKLITHYIITESPKSKNKSYPSFTSKMIKELPIKQISITSQQPFIEKADQMIDLNKQFHHNKKEFLYWLKIYYRLEKQSKKLESFYALDEEAFFAELKKKLPKEKKTLSPKETGEIKQYFENYRQKIIALKNEIVKTDKEIDKMVYDLYGLTDEEIEIVEKSP